MQLCKVAQQGFRCPLTRKANVDSSLLQDERDSIVLNVTEENNSVWWKQFCQCKRLADSCRIAFCLPMSNGHLERVVFPVEDQTDRNVWGKTDWTIYSALLRTSAPALCDWVQNITKIGTPKKHLCIPPLQYVSFVNRGPFKWERQAPYLLISLYPHMPPAAIFLHPQYSHSQYYHLPANQLQRVPASIPSFAVLQCNQ